MAHSGEQNNKQYVVIRDPDSNVIRSLLMGAHLRSSLEIFEEVIRLVISWIVYNWPRDKVKVSFKNTAHM